MDIAFVNPFITAVQETFKTMMRIEVTATPPVPKSSPYGQYDISGVVGLSGKGQGSVALSFDKATAANVITAMTGASLQDIQNEIVDGIGELVNIVAGTARRYLKLLLDSSLPSVIIGKNHVLTGQTGIETVVITFQTKLGTFTMELTLKSE